MLKSRSLALGLLRELGYDWDVYSPEFQEFRNSISVHSTAGSELLRISVQHVDPREAMRIANTMVDVFVTSIQEMNSENVRAARAFLAEQLEKFEADLERAEEELVLFQPAGFDGPTFRRESSDPVEPHRVGNAQG